MTTKAAMAIAEMKDVGKASYIRWARNLVEFAKLQSINCNDPKYAAFRDVLAVILMHGQFTITKVPGEKNVRPFVLWSTRLTRLIHFLLLAVNVG